MLLLLLLLNVYYSGGAITKLYATGPPCSVKSRNHKLAYTTLRQGRW